MRLTMTMVVICSLISETGVLPGVEMSELVGGI